jgi:hypothetical protein
MNRRLNLTLNDGLNTYQDTLDFMQTSYRDAFGALALSLGTKLILSGVSILADSISSGWIVVDGELMPFVGGAISPRVIIEELIENETFADGSSKPVYYTKRARLAVTGGFLFSELRRFKSDNHVADDSDVLASTKAVKRVADQLLALIGFESSIILKGCDASNVVGNTLVISAGVVKFDNVIVSTPAYAGQWPVYLKSDGTFSLVAPAAPFILFNPYTSQRYKDVLKRAVTGIGEVKIFKALSDRFDANGLGRWDMLGFKICDDVAGRTFFGYDRRNADPGDGIWDAGYNAVWNTGGHKTVTIAENQMPFAGIKPHTGPGGLIEGYSPPNAPGSDNFDPSRASVTSQPNAQPLENRPPYRVALMVERI